MKCTRSWSNKGVRYSSPHKLSRMSLPLHISKWLETYLHNRVQKSGCKWGNLTLITSTHRCPSRVGYVNNVHVSDKSISRCTVVLYVDDMLFCSLITYWLSCHTFTPIEKRANFFQIARFFVAGGTSEIARLPSGPGARYPIRSSSTLVTSVYVLATPLLH